MTRAYTNAGDFAVTFAATMLFGRMDPLAIFDAIAADLVARGAVSPDRVAAARAVVPAGRFPASALVDVGAPPDAVLRALATITGVAPAPPRAQWNGDVRAQLQVPATTWAELFAAPIGWLDRRPLVAFADVTRIASSGAMGLPDHVPCVALEADVRDLLGTAPAASARPLSFLAPPSAVAAAMPTSSPAFAAGTAPALAGTMVGAAPVTASPGAPFAAAPPAGAQALPSFIPPQSGPAASAAFPGVASQTPLPPFVAQPTPPPPAHAPSMVAVPPPPTWAAPPAPAAAAVSPSGTQLFTSSPVAPPASPSVPSSSPPIASPGSDAPRPVTMFAGNLPTFAPSPGNTPVGPQKSPFAPTQEAPLSAFAAPEPASSPAPQHTQMAYAAAPAGPAIGPGARVGRYVVDKKLGEGGMATVFMGNLLPGGPVDGGPGEAPAQAAIKIVHEHLLASGQGEELRRRFQREVAAMRQLSHKNIVACLDAGRVGQTEFLTTEFVGGGSLSGLLKRTGKLNPLLALAWFGDLLEGLGHAHEKGIVHRDLKPDNLLIALDGTVKVADFGIARVAEGTQLTATGGIIGTPSYMSPEQALANPLDARTDLYSAGVILYESITGRNPFEGDTVMAVLGNVLQNKVRPLGEVEPSVPFLVDVVITKLLSMRPDDRYPSAQAILDALKPALDRARAFRENWVAVVQKQPGALTASFSKEADLHGAFAKSEKAKGDAHRMRAGLAAYRAQSLMPDHRDAKTVMNQLGNTQGNTQAGAPPVRFARTSTRALVSREATVEGLQGDDKRTGLRELAASHLAEGNPLFASHYGRRGAALFGMQGGPDPELDDLKQVLPDDEIEEVRTLRARLAKEQLPASSAETTRARAWRPAASSEPAPSSSPSSSSSSSSSSAPSSGGGEAKAGLPGYLKAAIVIASTAVPIGVAILALRGCG